MEDSPFQKAQDEEKLIYRRRLRWKTRAEAERDQAIADWFQTESTLDETEGMHPMEALISEVISRLPIEAAPIDPELLSKGWSNAAGPFISSQANLLSISNGVATIQVLQPAMRYQLKQWEASLLEKLRAEFGGQTIKSIKIILG